MLRFLGAAFMLLLPLIILDVVLTAIFVYLGLNPDDAIENFKRAEELSQVITKALLEYCSAFYESLGVRTELARQLASFTTVGIIMLMYLPFAALLYISWRYEIRTYKKVRELWRAWRRPGA